MAKKVSKAIVKKEKLLSPDQERAASFTAATLEISKKQAEGLLFSEGSIEGYMKYNKKLSDIGAIEIEKKLQTALKTALKLNRMGVVKNATISWGIIREKLYGKDKPPTFAIGGENVKVRLGFNFKSYSPQRARRQTQEQIQEAEVIKPKGLKGSEDAKVLKGKEVKNVKRKDIQKGKTI